MSNKATRSVIAMLAVGLSSAPLSADDGSASFYFTCDVNGAECEYSCSATETSEFANDACTRDGDVPGNLYCGTCDRPPPGCAGPAGCEAIVDPNECVSSELGCFFDEERGGTCSEAVICGDAPLCACVRVRSRDTPRASFVLTALALATAFGIGVGRKQRSSPNAPS